MLATIFILLVVYQLKHFLADYPLQGTYMLGKFKDDWEFFLPLLSHAAVHGIFTLGVCLIVNPSLWWLSLVDMGIHFVMDRIKAGKKYLGRFKSLSAKEYVDNIRWAFWPQTDEKDLTDRGFSQRDIEQIKFHDESTRQNANKALKYNRYFWWSLGLDQMVHHLTHYYIIWKLVV